MGALDFLDIRTVMISFTLTNSMLTALLGVFWRKNREAFPGIAQWFWGFVLMTSGYALILLQEVAPAILSILLANAFTMWGMYLMLRGIRAFFGYPRQRLVHFMLLSAYLCCIVHATFVTPDLFIRMLSSTIIMLFYTCSCAFVAFSRRARAVSKGTNALGFVFAFASTFLCARIVMLLIKDYSSIKGFLSLQSDQAILILLYQMTNVGIIYALILLVAQRQREELAAKEGALAESQRIMDARISLLKAAAHSSSEQLRMAVIGEAKRLCPSDSGEFVLGSAGLERRGDTQEAIAPVLRAGETVATLRLFRCEGAYSEQQLALLRQIADLAYDIISQKQAEEAIDRERSNLKASFAAMPVGLLLLDGDRIVWKSNDAACRLLSATMAEMQGKPYEKLLMPLDEHRGALAGLIESAGQSERAACFIEIECANSAANGETAWLRVGAGKLELDGQDYYILAPRLQAGQGLQMVIHLAEEQLKGRIEFDLSDGFACRLIFQRGLYVPRV